MRDGENSREIDRGIYRKVNICKSMQRKKQRERERESKIERAKKIESGREKD